MRLSPTTGLLLGLRRPLSTPFRFLLRRAWKLFAPWLPLSAQPRDTRDADSEESSRPKLHASHLVFKERFGQRQLLISASPGGHAVSVAT